LFEQRVQR